MREKFEKINRAEYQEKYSRINFADEKTAERFEALRSSLISKLTGRVEWCRGGTKADCQTLSEGCRLCGEGLWSCLFINGECNCKCFYCPTPQDERCLPTTNSVSFEVPDDYVEYVREFGFKGVSISGGEPLLTPELTLSYISAVRRELGPEIYIWMYTNGTLVTPEILEKLREAGLNEIRFDIGAAGYSTDSLRIAAGIIPTVTVEIPAVPEDMGLLKKLMPELANIGVKHLNLHQLRLTPHNFEHLMKRDYTYILNERVTVIESELTALELMLYCLENGINLPVNYCSFPYKNRYQGLAARRRSGAYMVKSFEELTENGYIRLLTLSGSPEKIQAAAALTDNKELYEMSRDKTRISLHPSLLKEADTEGLELTAAYFSARQLPSVSYRNPFRTVTLPGGKNIILERFRVSEDIPFQKDDLPTPSDSQISPFETTEKCLLPYF